MSCVDVIERQGLFAIAGLVGQKSEVGSLVLGYPVVGTDSDLPNLKAQADFALVGIGQIHSPDRRVAFYRMLLDQDFNLPVIVSPMAYVSPHAHVGAGAIIMHGAIVNAGAVIGKNCIINSRTLIEHGARVGNHCHIATGAVLNGDAEVGEGSFVGSTTVVREGVVLGRQCVVGMGLSIRHNQPDGAQISENC